MIAASTDVGGICMFNKQKAVISVLMFEDKDAGVWSAQCLEYDVAAQARTLSDLFYEFERAIVGHIVVSVELGMVPFEKIKPAPKKFWTLFEASIIHVDREPSPYRLPNLEPRPTMRVAVSAC
jgi:hypothetical protein